MRRFRGLVMVSGEKAWDPLRAGPLRAHLNDQQQQQQQKLASDLPSLCDLAHIATQNVACRQTCRSPPDSSPLPPPPSALVGVDPVFRPTHTSVSGIRGPPPDPPCPTRRGSGGARALGELRLGVACTPPVAGEEAARAERQQGMKGKSKQGGRAEAMIEDRLEDMADGPKNAKITLSFPLSAAPLPPC
ncbi:hypothetical protein CRUP_036128 [Coryphaenoides rupestris]|nr:hypothetical protein CRUP_036128 [Coryphaenoides rupestris]